MVNCPTRPRPSANASASVLLRAPSAGTTAVARSARFHGDAERLRRLPQPSGPGRMDPRMSNSLRVNSSGASLGYAADSRARTGPPPVRPGSPLGPSTGPPATVSTSPSPGQHGVSANAPPRTPRSAGRPPPTGAPTGYSVAFGRRIATSPSNPSLATSAAAWCGCGHPAWRRCAACG